MENIVTYAPMTSDLTEASERKKYLEDYCSRLADWLSSNPMKSGGKLSWKQRSEVTSVVKEVSTIRNYVKKELDPVIRKYYSSTIEVPFYMKSVMKSILR